MADEGQAVDTGTAEGTQQGGSPEGSGQQQQAAAATPAVTDAAPKAGPSILDGKTFKTTLEDGTVKTTKGSQSVADLESGDKGAADGAGEKATGDEKPGDGASVKEGDSESSDKQTGGAEGNKQDKGEALDDLVQEGDPKGVVKRIKKAVSNQREAERKAEALAQEKADLEQKLAALEAGGKPDDGNKAPAKAGEDAPTAAATTTDDSGKPQRPAVPKINDFDNIDEYEAARDKYDGEELPEYFEKLAAWQTKQAQDAWEAQQAARAREAEDKRRIDAAVKVHPDFVEIALDNGLKYSDLMSEIIFNSENFTELAYHMGMNPEATERIAGLPEWQQALEMAQIELSLRSGNGKKSTSTDDGDSKPGANTKAGRKRTTAADAPIAPLGGTGTAAPFDPATADPKSLKDYLDRKQIAEMKHGGILP